MSRLSTPAYPNDAPIHGLTGIRCGALAPRSRRGTATHTARDASLGSGNHGMSRLSALAYTRIPDTRTMRPSTASPMCLCALRLLSTNIGYWVWRPRPSLSPIHCNTHYSRLEPRCRYAQKNLGSGPGLWPVLPPPGFPAGWPWPWNPACHKLQATSHKKQEEEGGGGARVAVYIIIHQIVKWRVQTAAPSPLVPAPLL